MLHYPDTNELLHVAFATNTLYVEHFCVALTSLLEHNNKHIGRIFLLKESNEDSRNLELTRMFIQKRYGREIEILNVDSNLANSFWISGHMAASTYFRILLPELIPKNIDRILYLDSDLVVHGDISELLKLSFDKNRVSSGNLPSRNRNDQYYVFAVDHYADRSLEHQNRLKNLGLRSGQYFNAGVLLINLQLWRSSNLSTKAISLEKELKESLVWCDQDLLNLLIDGNFGKLEAKFNSHTSIRRMVSDPIILHYTGSSKPWQYKLHYPYTRLYWTYHGLTPFDSLRHRVRLFYHDARSAMRRLAPIPLLKLYRSLRYRN